MRKALIYTLIITFSLFFVSCNKNVVYTEYRKFDNEEWFAKDTAKFEVNIEDNTSLHHVSIMVRHADAYPYSNLFLFVKTHYPDGIVKTDTMELVLANAKGEWLGSGAGDIFDLKIPVKRNIKFPLAGKYRFEFRQAMRTDPLPLIMDLGFEIEKAEVKN